jgi:hypothetical protein
MEFRRVFVAGLLVVAAVSLARELATREGVGPFEYIAGITIVGGLLFAAFRSSRRAIRRA